jgi:hypothetical protein
MESGNILGLDGISSETKGLLDGELVEAPNRVGMIQLCEDMIHEMINFTDSPMGLRALRTLPAEWFAE